MYPKYLSEFIMNTKHTLVILVFGLIFGNASAENLKIVGTLLPNGMKIYADKDSVTRRAHMSQMDLILVLAPAGNHPIEKLPLNFDCDEKFYYLPDGRKFPISVAFSWENSGVNYSLSGETITNGFNIACKKMYEFWK